MLIASMGRLSFPAGACASAFARGDQAGFVGALALIRSGTRPRAITVALVVGPVSVILGVLFAATADGGPRTRNGIVAVVVAVLLGVIGTMLGGLALVRSRRRTG